MADAAVPEPCDTPKQWEGTAMFQNQEDGALKLLSLSYDATKNRTRSFSTTLNDTKRRCGVYLLYILCAWVVCSCRMQERGDDALA